MENNQNPLSPTTMLELCPGIRSFPAPVISALYELLRVESEESEKDKVGGAKESPSDSEGPQSAQ